MKVMIIVVMVNHLIVPPCGIRCKPPAPQPVDAARGMRVVDVPPGIKQGPMTSGVAWTVKMNNVLYDFEGYE